MVARVLSRREILVTQANWERGRVTADQPVIDVSQYNDWTSVKVWWPGTRQMGSAEIAAWAAPLAPTAMPSSRHSRCRR